MNEKEIKKLDEKSEEKISGGAGLKEESKKFLKDPRHAILAYGAPLVRPEEILKKLKEIKTKEEK